jgi:hypothetical protein
MSKIKERIVMDAVPNGNNMLVKYNDGTEEVVANNYNNFEKLLDSIDNQMDTRMKILKNVSSKQIYLALGFLLTTIIVPWIGGALCGYLLGSYLGGCICLFAIGGGLLAGYLSIKKKLQKEYAIKKVQCLHLASVYDDNYLSPNDYASKSVSLVNILLNKEKKEGKLLDIKNYLKESNEEYEQGDREGKVLTYHKRSRRKK